MSARTPPPTGPGSPDAVRGVMEAERRPASAMVASARPPVFYQRRKAVEDALERYTGLGVEVLQGYAKIVNPWTVEVALNDGQVQRLTARTTLPQSRHRAVGPRRAQLPSAR